MQEHFRSGDVSQMRFVPAKARLKQAARKTFVWPKLAGGHHHTSAAANGADEGLLVAHHNRDACVANAQQKDRRLSVTVTDESIYFPCVKVSLKLVNGDIEEVCHATGQPQTFKHIFKHKTLFAQWDCNGGLSGSC